MIKVHVYTIGVFINSVQLKTMSSPLRASVLLITKGDPCTDINFAQILNLSNFFELKRTLAYIHLQLRTRNIQLVCLILQI
jgi:hypothetical protein